MKARTVAGLLAGMALLCLLLMAAFRYGETLHADRSETLVVQPSMTRPQVVESLGVLYDGYKPGQYENVDAMISRMQNRDSITYICCWRVAHSWDRYWVGFDKNAGGPGSRTWGTKSQEVVF